MGGEELLPRQFGYLDSADLDKLPTFVAPGRGATRTVSSCTRNDAQADPGKRSRRAANAIRSAGVHLSPLHPTLEHLHLAPQRQHLGLELRLVPLARCDRVEGNSQERVERRSDYGQ
jgi:hypothetical protein